MADAPKRPAEGSFAERLKAARDRENSQKLDGPGKSGRQSAGLGLGFRIATEMVAAIAVGALIGYGLDRWLGSTPWLMVVFVVLGSISGVLNAYRAAKALAASENRGAGLADEGEPRKR